MSFAIDSAGNFLVGGASKGHVFDAVQNDPSLRSDAKAAFDQFWIGQQTVARDAQNAANAAVAAAQADRDAQVAAAHGDRDIKVAAIQAQLDSLGGLPAVQAAQKARRIADAQAAKAAADAVLIAEGVEAAADAVPVKP